MRHLRTVLSIILLAASAATIHAQPALTAAPSTRATTEVTLSYPRQAPPAGAPAAAAPAPAAQQPPVAIRIDYGQPHLRGRTLNTDSLVPFDKPWRTGANAATTLTTGTDLIIGGKPVPKGTYVLWTLPSRAGWKLIVQKSDAPATMQAAMVYDAANDVATIDLRQQTLAAPIESLTMWLIPATGPGPARGELRMAWGTIGLSTDWSVR